jgi:hypothetical protein
VVAVMHAPFENDGEEFAPPHLTVVPTGPRTQRQPTPRQPTPRQTTVTRQPFSAPSPSVYRRRRLVLAVGLVVAVVAAILVLRAVLAGLGGGSLSTAGSSGPTSSGPASSGPVSSGPIRAAAHVHIVQPGDTLWSIAQTSAPGGDPRPIVDQLQQQLDGRPLWAGERLVVP